MRPVLLTGASGFIGGHLRNRLASDGWQPVTLARDGVSGESLALDMTSPQPAWREGLEGVELVVHLAGLAHGRAESDALTQVNERWPQDLYRAASEAGVEQFIWLSSIKVLGDRSPSPLKETDPYHPEDPYAASKMRAECGLQEAAVTSATRLTIIRPPLVYGPGVKANFAALMRLARYCKRGLPLPLGRAQGRRSLISVANLCDLILASVGHAGVFHAADAEDVSAADLLVRLGAKPGLLLPVPPRLMSGLTTLIGRHSLYDRLYEDLLVDRQHTRRTLDWQPPFSLEDQLREMLG